MARSGTESDPPALVTKIEAARLLGVSRDTIIRLIHRGRLEQVVLADGMTPRLRREDVLALVRGDAP